MTDKAFFCKWFLMNRYLQNDDYEDNGVEVKVSIA